MDKHELEDIIFDNVIKYAAEQEVEHIVNQFTEKDIEEDIKQITISPEFEKRMQFYFKSLLQCFLVVGVCFGIHSAYLGSVNR